MDPIQEKDGLFAQLDLSRMKAFGRLLAHKDAGDSFEYRKNLALVTFEIACITTAQRKDQKVILTEEMSKLIPFLKNKIDYSRLKSILMNHLSENLENSLLNQAHSGS